MAAWNPLLKNKEQRFEFEQMLALQSGHVLQEEDNVCFLCFSPDRKVTNPEFVIDIAGIGPTSCKDVYDAGISGAVTADNCDYARGVLELGCECEEEQGSDGIESDSDLLAIPPFVSEFVPDTTNIVPLPNSTKGPFMPYWVTTSIDVRSAPNMVDILSFPSIAATFELVVATKLPMYSNVFIRPDAYGKYYAAPEEPRMNLLTPVVINEDVVGAVSFEVLFRGFLTLFIPALSQHVHLVVENTLGQNFTFNVDPVDQRLRFLGEGDLHVRGSDVLVLSTTYDEFDLAISVATLTALTNDTMYCRYRFHIFSKGEFRDLFVTSHPLFLAGVTASILIFASLVFILYDWMVKRAQRKVVDSAKHTDVIVSSLFPKNVVDRMIQQAADRSNPKMKMQNFLAGDNADGSISVFNSGPIADLFPSAVSFPVETCTDLHLQS